MMKSIWFVMLMVLVVGSANPVSALTYNMFESFTNSDNELTWEADPLAGTSYDFDPGLSWSTTFSTAGTHNFGLFIDVEIDELENTFFNEYGTATGSPADGLSWEMDDPFYGTIWQNAQDNTLTNGNAVASLPADIDEDGLVDFNDVSMALMWNFSLLEGQTAFLNFILDTAAPTSGFYLAQVDPDSDASLYFSTSMQITGGEVAPIPEPSTFALFGSALAGLGLYVKRRRCT
jgi:hypothetical protein